MLQEQEINVTDKYIDTSYHTRIYCTFCDVTHAITILGIKAHVILVTFDNRYICVIELILLLMSI